MKNKLYFTDLIALEREFQLLVGGRIQNIYDLGAEHCYLLKITTTRETRQTHFLIIRPGQYLYLIKEPPVARRTIPSSFCQKIRKHFKNRRITEISLYGHDRIIRFYAGEAEKEHCLVVELFGEGNVSLCDPYGNLVSFIYPHRYQGKRLRVGEPHPEWKVDKTGPWDLSRLRPISFDQIISLFGRDMLEEVKHYQQLGKDKGEDKGEETVEEVVRKIVEGILTSQEGYLVGNQICLPYHYEYLRVKSKLLTVSRFTSYSQALECFLKPKLPKVDKAQDDQLTKNDGFVGRRNRVLMENQKQQEALTSKIDKCSQQLELVQQDKRVVEAKLQEMKGRLSETKNKDHIFSFSLEGLTVSLQASKSYYENVSSLYERRKVLFQKRERVQLGLKKALQSVDSQNQDSAGCGKSRDNRRAIKSPITDKITLLNDKWYQEYHWIFTKNNFLVICGKNSSQNENIVKRRMESGDIYLHSEVSGSGSALLKNPEGKLVSPIDLEQAGALVICHSGAWKSNIADRAYWVKPDQVSKTPNTGEYVTKGSFIVRGTRNYLSIPDLVLGATVMNNRLMIAPYQCLTSYPKKTKLVPGRAKRNFVVNKVMSALAISGNDKPIVDGLIPYFTRMS